MPVVRATRRTIDPRAMTREQFSAKRTRPSFFSTLMRVSDDSLVARLATGLGTCQLVGKNRLECDSALRALPRHGLDSVPAARPDRTPVDGPGRSGAPFAP